MHDAREALSIEVWDSEKLPTAARLYAIQRWAIDSSAASAQIAGNISRIDSERGIENPEDDGPHARLLSDIAEQECWFDQLVGDCQKIVFNNPELLHDYAALLLAAAGEVRS
jgi:hypothetical protein